MNKEQSNRIKLEAGQRFGMLVYLCDAGRKLLPSGQYNRVVKVRCDCGEEKEVRFVHLQNQKITSCGCKLGEKHGMRRTKLYGVWRAIHDRCFLGTSKSYGRYGGRGIKMCDEWANSFTAFKNWAMANGYKEGLHIDRENNNGHYEPDNCRFVTPLVNNSNKRNTHVVTYMGQTKPLTIILTELGIRDKYGLIRQRIYKGWSVEEAINKPVQKWNA